MNLDEYLERVTAETRTVVADYLEMLRQGRTEETIAIRAGEKDNSPFVVLARIALLRGSEISHELILDYSPYSHQGQTISVNHTRGPIVWNWKTAEWDDIDQKSLDAIRNNNKRMKNKG